METSSKNVHPGVHCMRASKDTKMRITTSHSSSRSFLGCTLIFLKDPDPSPPSPVHSPHALAVCAPRATPPRWTAYVSVLCPTPAIQRLPQPHFLDEQIFPDLAGLGPNPIWVLPLGWATSSEQQSTCGVRPLPSWVRDYLLYQGYVEGAPAAGLTEVEAQGTRSPPPISARGIGSCCCGLPFVLRAEVGRHGPLGSVRVRPAAGDRPPPMPLDEQILEDLAVVGPDPMRVLPLCWAMPIHGQLQQAAALLHSDGGGAGNTCPQGLHWSVPSSGRPSFPMPLDQPPKLQFSHHLDRLGPQSPSPDPGCAALHLSLTMGGLHLDPAPSLTYRLICWAGRGRVCVCMRAHAQPRISQNRLCNQPVKSRSLVDNPCFRTNGSSVFSAGDILFSLNLLYPVLCSNFRDNFRASFQATKTFS